MSFFLLGSYSQNAGPDNVNKALIRQSGSELVYAHSKNKFIYNIETVIKILTSNQVLISGVCAPRFYALLRIFCKRYSYLMHGCIKYENKINKLQLKPRDIELEEKVIQWAKEKGILDKATPLAQAGKTLEEVKELIEAVEMQEDGLEYFTNSKVNLVNTEEEVKDALGDILVTIIIGAELQGLKLTDCLESAYNVISKRTGKMVGGVFVKDEK